MGEDKAETYLIRSEAANWWRQALADLETARVNLRARRYYACCFFCQQSAEKALKALHIQLKRELPPRTHNLIELGRRLRVPRNLASNLVELNPEFVVTRYPNAANAAPVDVYTREMAEWHYRKAKEVLKWARSEISK